MTNVTHPLPSWWLLPAAEGMIHERQRLALTSVSSKDTFISTQENTHWDGLVTTVPTYINGCKAESVTHHGGGRPKWQRLKSNCLHHLGQNGSWSVGASLRLTSDPMKVLPPIFRRQRDEERIYLKTGHESWGRCRKTSDTDIKEMNQTSSDVLKRAVTNDGRCREEDI